MNQVGKRVTQKPPPRAHQSAGRMRRKKRPMIKTRRREAWAALATDAFAEDWENEKDAEYDRWKEHYGVSEGRRGVGPLPLH
jgi:hypothetical protein